MIPQFIPQYSRQEIAKQISDYVLDANNFFSENTKTQLFENEIAKFLGVKHCITTNNGTMALVLALLANGIKTGDKVLIPNLTMMSTQAAVQLIGAIPIFIDIDPNNLCMDLQQATQAISRGEVKAVIYVTLNGRCADFKTYHEFEMFCIRNSVVLIEDNAQSFGSNHSKFNNIACPSGGIGCFSLSFHKLLSTGQGGYCVANNDELALRLRELKNVGRVQGGADIHERFGINSKFTDIQSIVGSVELKNIKEKIEKKKHIYKTYYNELKDVEGIYMFKPQEHHTPWFVDLYTNKRDALQQFLKENGIGSRSVYLPLTTQKINKDSDLTQVYAGMSGYYSSRGLWLPSSLDLTDSQITFICNTIRRYK